MQPLELIWDGEVDLGTRREALLASLENPPAGVLAFLDDSGIDISTRSTWAFATWGVGALMIGFGCGTGNWFLLVLAPFMIGAAMMQSLGRLSIRVREDEVAIFEGVEGVGRRICMRLPEIQGIEYAVKHGRGGSTAWIVLRDKRRAAKFGRYLNAEQASFAIAFLLDSIQSLAA